MRERQPQQPQAGEVQPASGTPETPLNPADQHLAQLPPAILGNNLEAWVKQHQANNGEQ